MEALPSAVLESLEPRWLGYLLLLSRAGGFFMTLPAFSLQSVPATVRMAFTALLAMAAFAFAGFPAYQATGLGDVLMMGMAEAFLGIFAALPSRWIMDTAMSAGNTASQAAGFNMGSMFDPHTGESTSSVADLLLFFSLSYAIMLGLPEEAAAWLCRSASALPPGIAVHRLDVQVVLTTLMDQFYQAVALSVRLSFPMIASITTGQILFGLLGRVAPQVGLQNIGFSVAITAGAFALYVSAYPLASIVGQASIDALRNFGG